MIPEKYRGYSNYNEFFHQNIHLETTLKFTSKKTSTRIQTNLMTSSIQTSSLVILKQLLEAILPLTHIFIRTRPNIHRIRCLSTLKNSSQKIDHKYLMNLAIYLLTIYSDDILCDEFFFDIY